MDGFKTDPKGLFEIMKVDRSNSMKKRDNYTNEIPMSVQPDPYLEAVVQFTNKPLPSHFALSCINVTEMISL